jgi:hypothetical protein
MSIIETMISAVIVVVGIRIGTKGHMNALKTSSHLSMVYQRNLIGTTLGRNVSCHMTMSKAKNSLAGTLVELLDDNGKILVGNTGQGTEMFGLSLRAELDPSGEGVIVKAARLKTGSNINSNNPQVFLPDPLGKTITWADVKSNILPSGIPLCHTSDYVVDYDNPYFYSTWCGSFPQRPSGPLITKSSAYSIDVILQADTALCLSTMMEGNSWDLYSGEQHPYFRNGGTWLSGCRSGAYFRSRWAGVGFVCYRYLK